MKYLPIVVIFFIGVVLAARVRGVLPFIPSL